MARTANTYKEVCSKNDDAMREDGYVPLSVELRVVYGVKSEVCTWWCPSSDEYCVVIRKVG